MFFRIPDEFLIDVKEVIDLEDNSSEYRCLEDEINPFKEADDEYVEESIKG